MRFAKAFLHAPATLDEKGAISRNLANLLEAVLPGPAIPPVCSNVMASNLGFALPMNWALAEADRRTQIHAALREQITRFEPRLSAIYGIESTEDDEGNILEFVIQAQSDALHSKAEIHEIEVNWSLLDQEVEEGGA